MSNRGNKKPSPITRIKTKHVVDVIKTHALMKKYSNNFRLLLLFISSGIFVYGALFFDLYHINTLLYYKANIFVTLNDINPRKIVLTRHKEGERIQDITSFFGQSIIDQETACFFLNESTIPLKNIRASVTQHPTAKLSIRVMVSESGYDKTFQNTIPADPNLWAPLPGPNGACNFKGNVYLLKVAVLLWGSVAVLLWAYYWIISRCVYSGTALIFGCLLIVKSYYLYRLDIISRPETPFVLLISLVLEMFFWSFPLLLLNLATKRTAAKLIGNVLLIIFSIIVIADFIHFYLSNEHFRWDNLRFVEGVSLKSVATTELIICSALLIIVLFCVILLTRRREGQKKKYLAHLITVSGLSFLLFIVINPFESLLGSEVRNFENYSRMKLFKKVCMPTIYVVSRDLLFYIYPPVYKKISLSVEEHHELQALGIQANPSKTGLRQPPKRVVLIALESLSRNLIHYYNKHIPKNFTPRLTGLAESVPHLNNFYTSTFPTLYGMMSLLCSHLDFETATDPAYETFPEVLKSHGFKTIFMQSSNKTFSNYDYYFHLFGFDRQFTREYFASKYPDSPKNFDWGFTDDILYSEIIELLESTPKNDKLFITALTIDTHMPGGRCRPDIPFPIGHDGKPPHPIYTSLYSADYSIGEFVDRLREKNLLDDETLVILTADHAYIMNGFYLMLDGVEKKRQLHRILCIILTGNQEINILFQGVENTYASQIDMAPTLLEILGIAKPPNMIGQSIFQKTTGGFALSSDNRVLQFISPVMATDIPLGQRQARTVTEKALVKWYLNSVSHPVKNRLSTIFEKANKRLISLFDNFTDNKEW